MSLNLMLNWEKTVVMQFGNREEDIKIEIAGQVLKVENSTRFLGIEINNMLKWTDHVRELMKKLNKGLFAMQQIRQSINLHEILKVYYMHSSILICLLAQYYGHRKKDRKIFFLKVLENKKQPLEY